MELICRSQRRLPLVVTPTPSPARVIPDAPIIHLPVLSVAPHSPRPPHPPPLSSVMASRRRDSGRTAYSYADAYRTLGNPTTQPNVVTLTNLSSSPSSAGHGHTLGSSSEDEGGIVFTTGSDTKESATGSHSETPTAITPDTQAQVPEQPVLSAAPTAQDSSIARGHARPARGRDIERMSLERDIIQSDRDESPLSPPRPSFLVGSAKAGGSSDRGSWASSANDSASLDLASDSESVITPESSSLNLPGTVVTPAAGTGTAILQPRGAQRVRGHPATAIGRMVPRTRNHHRRRPTFDDSLSHSPSAGTISLTTSINPFDTPPSSIYVPNAAMGGNNDRIPSGNTRPPPSAFAFPFQSHPGNPDPGMSIPGVARRASFDSFKSRPRSTSSSHNPASTPIYQAGGGYQSQGDVNAEVLAKPNAPFMASGEGREGSPIPPPSPNLSQSNVFRNSVAGALTGGKPFLRFPSLS